MVGVAKAVNLSGVEFLQAIIAGEIASPAIGKALGFELLEAEEVRVVFGGKPEEYHYNPMGIVHGGLAATLLDSALGCSVLSTLPKGIIFTTLELKVNYIRAMSTQTGYVRCEGKIIHAGRQMATSEAKLVDADGKLYAHGTTTCLVFPIPSQN
jgi:uncharacterized protein (TIGR00369 family)